MGTLITAAADFDTKPDYLVEDVFASNVIVAHGHMALWVGGDIPTPLQAATGLQKCLQAMREAGWRNPPFSQLAFARFEVTGQTISDGVGAPPTLSETIVALLRGSDFEVENRSSSTHAHRMFEMAQEAALKAT